MQLQTKFICSLLTWHDLPTSYIIISIKIQYVIDYWMKGKGWGSGSMDRPNKTLKAQEEAMPWRSSVFPGWQSGVVWKLFSVLLKMSHIIRTSSYPHISTSSCSFSSPLPAKSPLLLLLLPLLPTILLPTVQLFFPYNKLSWSIYALAW